MKRVHADRGNAQTAATRQLYWLGRIVLAIICAASMLLAADTKDKNQGTKFHGYVTSITSPTEFQIEDQKILGSADIPLEIGTAELTEVDKADAAAAKKADPAAAKTPAPTPTFKLEDIRVGTELEVTGSLDPATHTLKATGIKVLYEDRLKPKGEAVLETQPNLAKKGTVWSGELHADGQNLIVDETTSIQVFPTKAQKQETTKQAKNAKNVKPAKGDEDKPEEEAKPVDLQSPDQIKLGMVVRWWGERQPDGKILAKKLEFRPLEDTFTVLKLLSWLDNDSKKAFAFKPPDMQKNKNGTAVLDGKKYKALPVKPYLDYVNDLGNRLQPAYMRDMPAGDAQKVNFRFGFLDGKVPNAYANRDGTVVVTQAMFDALENEDQLAFVIAHEMAHVAQRHAFREERANATKRTIAKGVKIAGAFTGGIAGLAMQIGGSQAERIIKAGYRRGLENQADRLALEYMAAAGFDARQGPRVWKVMDERFGSQKHRTFWASHDTNSIRRSYLMAEIRNNYGDVDFSAYQAKPEEYQKFTAMKTATDAIGQNTKKKK
jgi:hypothetical protein